MKKNNEKKNSIKRFTILDLIICLVVLSVAVYFGMKFFTTDNSNKEYNVTYSVKIKMADELIQNFSKGDKILTADGEKIIGEIVGISSTVATEKHYTISGIDNFSNSVPDSFKEFMDETSSQYSRNVNDLSEADNSAISSVPPDESNINEAPSSSTSEDMSSEQPSQDTPSHDESSEPTVEQIEIPINGYSFVTITISANLDLKSDCFYLNNQPLKINSSVEVTTNKFCAIGECTQISEFVSE